MPIAKKDLFDGFTLVAAKGTYVSTSAVDRHGWHDDVEAGPDPADTTDTADVYAPKGRPQAGDVPPAGPPAA